MGGMCSKDPAAEEAAVKQTTSTATNPVSGAHGLLPDDPRAQRIPLTDDEKGTMDAILHQAKKICRDMSKNDFKLMFAKYDEDDSGYVDYKEFVGLVSDGLGIVMRPEEYKLLAQCLDADGGGHIDMHEFHSQLDDISGNDIETFTKAPIMFVDTRAPAIIEIERKVKIIYMKETPEKVSQVPKLMKKYTGQEAKVFANLLKKYGISADDPMFAVDRAQ